MSCPSIFFGSVVLALCASDICHFLCSVFTPYYSETVLYSIAELQRRNEDGISTLFYLQKIYPGLFFLSMVKFANSYVKVSASDDLL